MRILLMLGGRGSLWHHSTTARGPTRRRRSCKRRWTTTKRACFTTSGSTASDVDLKPATVQWTACPRRSCCCQRHRQLEERKTGAMWATLFPSRRRHAEALDVEPLRGRLHARKHNHKSMACKCCLVRDYISARPRCRCAPNRRLCTGRDTPTSNDAATARYRDRNTGALQQRARNAQ